MIWDVDEHHDDMEHWCNLHVNVSIPVESMCASKCNCNLCAQVRSGQVELEPLVEEVGILYLVVILGTSNTNF